MNDILCCLRDAWPLAEITERFAAIALGVLGRIREPCLVECDAGIFMTERNLLHDDIGLLTLNFFSIKRHLNGLMGAPADQERFASLLAKAIRPE